MPALRSTASPRPSPCTCRAASRLPVVSRRHRSRVDAGECVVLGGPSGAGKSSILKMLYGNYRCDAGQHPGRATAASWSMSPRAAPRRSPARCAARRIGYVSQFLRVDPARRGARRRGRAAAWRAASTRRARASAAATLLRRLNMPERLWRLPPATFSGGEQQRVNIARGFRRRAAVLLLDEPTASLDAANRAVVVDLIAEKKRRGAAIVGIFHDEDVRDASPTAIVDVTPFRHRSVRSCMKRDSKTDMLLANARIVLRGSRDRERLAALSPTARSSRSAKAGRRERGEDLGGDFLLPGLVELHTDHLEAHFAPRPRSTGIRSPPSSPMTRSSPPPASPPCSIRCASGARTAPRTSTGRPRCWPMRSTTARERRPAARRALPAPALRGRRCRTSSTRPTALIGRARSA